MNLLLPSGLCLATALSFVACADSLHLNLAGTWRLRLDPADAGLTAGWPSTPIASTNVITLPGTTDLAGFGFPLDTNTMLHAVAYPVTTRFPAAKEPARADEHGYLVRRHLFVGPAWYERDVEIPPSWAGRSVTLCLERALWQTDVWVDGRHLAPSDSLVTPHQHDLGVLAAGPHRLTVRVDNRMIHNLSTITHAYGPETQSRWNGMIGMIRLEAFQPTSIRSLVVFPAPDRLSARIVLKVMNTREADVRVSFLARLQRTENEAPLAESTAPAVVPPGTSTHELQMRLAAPAAAWDEFQPICHRVQVSMACAGQERDHATASFGFRHVERVGKEIRLNGRTIFLRGTLDCAVYPRTGHPPMDLAGWERVLKTVKEYGFNHVRFHTWCPPDAAFEAADYLGIYLQAETPAWVDDWGTQTITQPRGIGRDADVEQYLRAEGRRISEAYGNHPSFVLFSIGNEFGMNSTDWDRVNAMATEIKSLDPRRLYSACGARRNLPADDFWFTHRTGASTRGVGPARTDWDFSEALATSPVPVIAHETGQHPVFPDYDALLPKFDGPLLPLNLVRYQRDLRASGVAGRAADFVRASARFQFTQYKAEHEAMLRTRGYSGYQLLMLNDFTGQSEALVGILDPFWESKGVVSAAEVRAWNAPTVILARFRKYVWTADETLRVLFEAAHFGAADLPAGDLKWALRGRDGLAAAEGTLNTPPLAAGRVSDLGTIELPLHNLRTPSAFTLTARLEGCENGWPLWIYPDLPGAPEPPGVHVTSELNEPAMAVLRDGGKVLLLAHGVKNPHAARTGFESVYWSAGWWGDKFSSLGVLCDPAHPALRGFPNDGWSDWQWHELCNGATTFELAGAPADFKPIVQPVPDFHFNTPLGHVFEARVGGGSLLVCGYDLSSQLEQRPAARQLRRSLLSYVNSPEFRPAVEVPASWIEARCLPR